MLSVNSIVIFLVILAVAPDGLKYMPTTFLIIFESHTFAVLAALREHPFITLHRFYHAIENNVSR